MLTSKTLLTSSTSRFQVTSVRPVIPALLTTIDSGPSSRSAIATASFDFVWCGDVSHERQAIQLGCDGFCKCRFAVEDRDPSTRGMQTAGNAGADPAAGSRHDRRLAV